MPMSKCIVDCWVVVYRIVCVLDGMVLYVYVLQIIYIDRNGQFYPK